MEVSVRFTDGQNAPADAGCTGPGGAGDDAGRYIMDETALGRVWIRPEALILTPPVRIRYEKRPWIEQFEFDGIRPAPARRRGIGTKGARGFVQSLSTIYSAAYDDYRAFGGEEDFDAEGYFRHASEYFAALSDDPGKTVLLKKFCGFTENMWREGDQQMLDICIGTILPVIRECAELDRIFEGSITDEFSDWLITNGN